MNTDLSPRESASSDVPQRSTGPMYGAGAEAEPARKVKELPHVKNSTIMARGHNVEGESPKF
jgi:hypothetical protein